MINGEPKLYIIIPVYNRLYATKECLESLRCQTYQNFHVIVVDDGSTDGTAEFIEENYAETALLKGDGELWWTGATNRGVEYALKVAEENDYILTLNNDTLLPSDYLQTLISLAREAPKALIGSIARDADLRGLAVDEGIAIKWFSAKFAKIKPPVRDRPRSFYSVSALPGRGTLIPARVFCEIGLFDAESFPHYAADYDFSLRAFNKGYALLLHPDCYLYSKTKLTGVSNTYGKLSFRAWLGSFVSLKSPNNLKTRVRFGLRHSPMLCRPSYIVCDLLRVTIGTFRNQIRNIL